MARPLRINKAGLYYHAMNRGNNKQQIFFSDDDYALFVEILFDSCLVYNIVLHAFTLMPNHFHLFFHTTHANLSRFMQRLCTTFAIRYNLRHNRVGHLFQGRFKSQVVDSPSYACVLSRYIHLNPVNTDQYAGSSLEEKAALLTTWRWSSFYYYFNPAAAAGIPCLDVQEVLSHFGASPADQKKHYSRYLQEGLACSSEDIRNAVFDNLVEQSIIGDDTFVDHIKDLLDAVDREHPISGKLFSIPLDIMAAAYASLPGVALDDLRARGRGATAIRNPGIFLASLVSVSAVSLTEIGHYFGGLSVSRVSKIVRALMLRFKTDAPFRTLMLSLEECLRSRSYDRIASLDTTCLRQAYG
jgi:REP element-mobilizing transposase RayT